MRHGRLPHTGGTWTALNTHVVGTAHRGPVAGARGTAVDISVQPCRGHSWVGTYAAPSTWRGRSGLILVGVDVAGVANVTGHLARDRYSFRLLQCRDVAAQVRAQRDQGAVSLCNTRHVVHKAHFDSQALRVNL